ncbi:MAG: nucleotide pyrophosphohydrolase [Rikenellaceae bacterium]
MKLSELQSVVDSWITKEGVRYFDPMTNLAILMEECGELARLMSRTYGEQSFKESDKNRDIADEVADVLWVLTAIANQTGVDLEKALTKNIVKKNTRDINRHKNNLKLK